MNSTCDHLHLYWIKHVLWLGSETLIYHFTHHTSLPPCLSRNSPAEKSQDPRVPHSLTELLSPTAHEQQCLHLLAGTALPPGAQTPAYDCTCSRAAPLPLALQTSLISEATLAITSPSSARLSPVYISRVSCSGLYSFLASLNHILNLHAFRATRHVIKFYVFWQMPNGKYLYYTVIWNSLITLKILCFFYLIFSLSQ